jgi:hypothetical protein
MEGLDQDERKVELQRIKEEAGTVPKRVDAREPITRVKAYVKQFENLVRLILCDVRYSLTSTWQATSIARTDCDIEVVGVIVYTGNDQAARQAAGLFSGSGNARSLIDRDKIRVQHLVDMITTKFR